MALFPTRERLADRQIGHQIDGGLGGIDQSFVLHKPEQARSNEPIIIVFASCQPGAVVGSGMLGRSQLLSSLPDRCPRWLPRRLRYCPRLPLNAERQANRIARRLQQRACKLRDRCHAGSGVVEMKAVWVGYPTSSLRPI